MYAMYLRKSRADREAEARGEGETLARHESILTDLSIRQNLVIGAIYKEIVSGETISARPKVQQLLLEVMQGKWEGVLVMEVERLARGDTKDQGTVAEAFKFSGTKIITPAKTYDPNNEFDEEYFEFSLFMSRREYKTINRRIQTGRITAFNEGWYIAGTAPYGYEKVKHKQNKGYTLEIIDDEANVVRNIFHLYAEGEPQSDGTSLQLGCYQICDRLNSIHIPSRTGGQWSAASIMDIIRNPTYAGYQRWQWRAEKKSMVDGSIIKSRKKDDNCLKVRGRYDPIISEELFEKAQKIRRQKKTARPGNSNALLNPLSGLVYCQKCKSLMTRQQSNTKDRYGILRCPNNKCDNISSPVYLVEARLMEGLKEWLKDYKMEWQTESHEDTKEALAMLESNIKNLSSRSSQIEQQISNTYDLLEQGIYDLGTFQARRKTLEEKLGTMKDELSRLQEQCDNIKAREQAIYNFVPAVQNIIDTYWSIDSAETRNAVLREVIERVEYLKTERMPKGQRDSAKFTLQIYPKLPERP